MFHVSNLNVRELDAPTHLSQFDANCGKIRYVSGSLDLELQFIKTFPELNFETSSC